MVNVSLKSKKTKTEAFKIKIMAWYVFKNNLFNYNYN